MSVLQITARLVVHKDKLTEFKAVAEQCMQSVREKDSGTLQYDWFFSEEQTECIVRERYRDSEAVLEHITNLGTTLAALLEVCDMNLEIYGAPSAELVAATAEIAPKIYTHFQSI